LRASALDLPGNTNLEMSRPDAMSDTDWISHTESMVTDPENVGSGFAMLLPPLAPWSSAEPENEIVAPPGGNVCAVTSGAPKNTALTAPTASAHTARTATELIPAVDRTRFDTGTSGDRPAHHWYGGNFGIPEGVLNTLRPRRLRAGRNETGRR